MRCLQISSKKLWILLFLSKFALLIFILSLYRRCVNNSYIAKIPCLNQSLKTVTRIIHQSWKTKNIPSDFQRYIPSWKKCFPDWEYKFWTDEDNRNLVIRHYPWFLKTYDSFPKEIYRADVARYLYLYQYGGIYTDMDNECLKPFEHLLENYTFVFGTINNVSRRTPLPENYVQNSFMYSRPREAFWLDLIRGMQPSYFHKSADIETGPELLCRYIHEYRTLCPHNHNVKIYDGWYFNPISWGGVIKYKYCKPVGVMTYHEWYKCREDFQNRGSYVLQYHSHMW